jgi:hypothetical protein
MIIIRFCASQPPKSYSLPVSYPMKALPSVVLCRQDAVLIAISNQ